jgi:hypothetical protein
MKDLRRLGGIAAIVSAASYVFAIGLYLTFMKPLADPGLGIGEYMSFCAQNRILIYIWNFSMYIAHGICLALLVPAMREGLKEGSPRLALIASAFGFIWTSFVLLSGFINIWGNEALIKAYATDPERAEILKDAISAITLGIDSSDKVLGSLWIGLASLGALKKGLFPKAVAVFGICLGGVTLVAGICLPPNDSTASFLFGIGAIIWWIGVGIRMLAKKEYRESLPDYRP